ncbi:hypothetical protein RHS03_08619, partial [Rhizoctonia solani]
MGDSEIRLVTGYKQPDKAFGVYEDHGSDAHYTRMHPRVVFESAVSQSKGGAREKAELYLTETEVECQVYAVVILNFENVPTQLPNLTVLDDKKCRVTLEVWVCNETIGTRFPLDDCQEASISSGGIEDVSLEHGLDDNIAQDCLSDTYNSPNVSSNNSTPSTGTSKSLGSLVKQRGETIVVLDESETVEVELPDLVLDFYDFFRVCQRNPGEKVDAENRPINIPIRGLRDTLLMALKDERGRLRELSTAAGYAQGSAAGAVASTTRTQKRRAEQEPAAGFAEQSKKRSKSGKPVAE